MGSKTTKLLLLDSLLQERKRMALQSMSRAASLGQLARVTALAVPAPAPGGAIGQAVPESPSLVLGPSSVPLTSYSMSKQLLGREGQMRISSGLGVATSVRSIHAGNVDVPDFSHYRRSAVQSPSAKSGDSAAERMSYSYVWLVVLGSEVPTPQSPLSA